MDLPNANDFFRIGKAEMLVNNQRLSPEEVDRKGTDVNNFVASASAMADECMGQLAGVKADLYVGTARGDALDRRILDQYPDLPRKQASPSFGYITFTFTPATTSAFTIPDGTILSTADSVQFLTVGSAAVAIGTSTKTVPIRSLLAGSGQKASAGKITSLVSQIPGVPGGTTVTVTNAAATFGGEPKERDDEYVVRFKLHHLAARRATIGAIEAAILSVPGIRKASVFENLDSLGRPIGYVQAIVADAYTEQFVSSTTLPATYATQLASLGAQIEAVLREYRAAGVGVSVQFASAVIQSVRLALSYAPGADQTAVSALVQSRVIQYINALAPGEVLSIEGIKSTIRTTTGIVYTGNELLSPTGDVVPLPGQVIRTSTTFTTVSS